ncbi:type III pantothenate kinase [Luminiphilus syltensis NOR5-1B]|uniref:Type III pantothenate kinase n=1 Tax=Luminiphilus syltensis NOR5-1B TaxID=565045 RepID=B8KWD0_9GAMM|nr:type III pantothenate kinase [Luminiphilus syltensis]EED34176.1 type III pantothenate kinase [Luminiphilus syltensis NOR5-1B]
MSSPPVLLLDVGNSTVKWRFVGETGVNRCSAQADALIESLKPAPAPSAIVLSSVAGEAFDAALVGALERHFSIAVYCARSVAKALGITNAYAKPESLGVDRWMAMIGAARVVGSPVVVIDAGSAITIDVVARDGLHIGGFILPGVRMMCETLIERTGKVRYEQLPAPSTAPGDATGACVASGAWLAACASVNAVVADYPEYRALITGGDARAMMALGVVAELRENLVLDGLEYWAVSKIG